MTVESFLLAFVLAASQPDSTPGWHDDQSIEVAGKTRYFRYFVPTSLVSARPPAVIFFHGGGSSMRMSMPPNNVGSAAWPDVAEFFGFILVVPNGTSDKSNDPFSDSQNWNDCRAEVEVSTADDVAFAEALVAEMQQRLAVDPQRIYISGSSNGGFMNYRLMAELPDVFAGAAPFIANQPANSDCAPVEKPMAVMMMVGTADPLMPFAGGSTANDRGLVLSSEETRDRWIALNNTSNTPIVTQLPDLDPTDGSTVTAERYPGSVDVLFYRMDGAGHAIPSRSRFISNAAEVLVGLQNRDVEGATAAWLFLSEFRREALFGDGFDVD